MQALDRKDDKWDSYDEKLAHGQKGDDIAKMMHERRAQTKKGVFKRDTAKKVVNMERERQQRERMEKSKDALPGPGPSPSTRMGCPLVCSFPGTEAW